MVQLLSSRVSGGAVRRAHLEGEAAALRAPPRARCGGRRSRRPVGCRVVPGRGPRPGGGTRRRRPRRRGPAGPRPSRRPRGGPARPSRRRSSARSSRRTPARWSRVLASARSPVSDSRVPAIGSAVTRATSRPAAASHSATPTPIGPPTVSCTRTGPSGRAPGPSARTAAASTTATLPSPGTSNGAGRPPVARTTASPASRAASRSATVAATPVVHLHAEPAAFGRQPRRQRRQALPPGADGGGGEGAARVRRALDDADAVPTAGEHPGALEAGRTAPDDQDGCGDGSGDDRGLGVGVRRLVAGAGLAHAADERVAVVADPAGLVAQDARAGRRPRADLGHQPRVGDLGPGHLHQVGRAVGQGGRGHRRVDDTALQHDGHPPRGGLPHGRAQRHVDPVRGVGVGPVGGGRVRAAPHHGQQVEGVGQHVDVGGRLLGGDPGPRGELVTRQAEGDEVVGPRRPSGRPPAPRGSGGGGPRRRRRRGGW